MKKSLLALALFSVSTASMADVCDKQYKGYSICDVVKASRQQMEKQVPVRIHSNMEITKALSFDNDLTYYIEVFPVESTKEYFRLVREAGMTEYELRQTSLDESTVKLCSNPSSRDIINAGVTFTYVMTTRSGEFIQEYTVDNCVGY